MVTPSSATAAPPFHPAAMEQEGGGLEKFGFFWSIIAQLPWFCFLFDAYLGPLHLPMISLIIGLLTALLSGKLFNTISEMPGIGYIFLTVWFFVGLPFAYWKGGTLTLLLDVWIVSAATFFVVASMVNTRQRLKISVIALAAGTGLTMFGAYFKGMSIWGRLGIPGTRFGDSNDLALVCVMLLPLIGFMALNKVNPIIRLMAVSVLPLLFYTFLKTGSRGGILGMAAVVLTMFFKTGVRNKMKLALALGVVVTLAPFVAEEDVLARFLLFTTDKSDALEQSSFGEGASDSSKARIELLKRSIEVTFKYPIFGVGMGNFMTVDHEMSREEGKLRGAWHVTHNMYTQLSSEAGIPAFLMLVAMLVYSWRALTKLEKTDLPVSPEEQKYIRNLAFAFKASLAGYCVCGTFLGVAYVGQLPVLIALISQFSKTHLVLAKAPPMQPAVRPVPQRRLVYGQ